jgi:hypothetical protein
MKQVPSIALLLLCGGMACSGSDDAGASSPITQFSYHATWGPCRPDLEPCLEELVATPDGAFTHTGEGNTRSSVFTPADASDFRRFLNDPALSAAISDPAPCPPLSDNWQTVTLARAGGQAPLVKDVHGCEGAIYDAIFGWVEKARGYFPP